MEFDDVIRISSSVKFRKGKGGRQGIEEDIIVVLLSEDGYVFNTVDVEEGITRGVEEPNSNGVKFVTLLHV